MASGATRRVIRTPPTLIISTKTVAIRIGKIAVGERATASPTPDENQEAERNLRVPDGCGRQRDAPEHDPRSPSLGPVRGAER